MKISRIGLAVIGDEVLLGEIADRNVHLLAGELARLGADLAYAAILPDNLDFLVRHLSWMTAEFDQVITTGGIGTTHDDLTREAVSVIIGGALQEDPEIMSYLEDRTGSPVPDRLRRLAMIPEGARKVGNPRTGIPGFSVGNLVVLPGIPELVESMMGDLEEIIEGVPFQSRVIRSHLSESRIAQCLEQAQRENPDVKIGSYPQSGDQAYRVKIVLRSRDARALDDAEKAITNWLKGNPARS